MFHKASITGSICRGKHGFALIAMILAFALPAVADAPQSLQSVAADFTVTLGQDQQLRLYGVAPISNDMPHLPGWLGESVTMETVHTDRYGIDAVWLRRTADGKLLQAALVEAGLAMPYTGQTDGPCPLPELPAPATAHIESAQAADAFGRYVELHGTIEQIDIYKRYSLLRFAKGDTAIYLPKKPSLFSEAELRKLEGKAITARGYLYRFGGPRIRLFHRCMLKEQS